MDRVPINPDLLRWARERSGRDVVSLSKPFPKLGAWERGEIQPTLKQLENFAKATHTPIGYLFLQKSPIESIPIPDFRTVAKEYADRPSPDLLDTVYLCQQRQEWYRDFARIMGETPLPIVGSAALADDVEQTATDIRTALSFDIEERRQTRTWTGALHRFIEQADALGVLVMVSGVVGSNNRRKLDPQEFRGFALADDLAPLVFINGSDTKSAQMFTLAHELAHIWLGRSALSDTQAAWVPEQEVERWCNQIAAELLVPLAMIRDEFREGDNLHAEIDRLAKHFRVSTLVILRRIHDIGGLSREQLWREYEEELARLRALSKGNGGNFYLSQPVRVSKRFARALFVSTFEGQTSFTEAFRMLGLKEMATFRELGLRLGVGF